jgi:lipocalin
MTHTPFLALLLALPFFLLIGCGPPSGALPGAEPLESVDQLDLDRYLGRWHEIARYPNSFEEGLVAVTATYELREDGDIRVINAGHKGSPDGPLKKSVGRAWIPDPDEPAQLKVRFFWPFTGAYWVIALDDDYQWSIVGEPKRRYLWILARDPDMPEALYEELLEQVVEHGYDPTMLERVPH